MATDQIDLHRVAIVNSPAVADWPITVAITRVRCTPAGGFELAFNSPIPASWKWPSNPADPSDNFQYTVWMIVAPRAGGLFAAGFVQMWQGRAMGTGALPPIFAPNPDTGVPGYTNWWGDVRKPWGPMSDYVPQAGDVVGILVTAGNGRLTSGVTSVAERSNVVVFPVHADDSGDQRYDAAAPPVDPPPVVVDPPAPPPIPLPTPVDVLLEAYKRIEGKLDTIAADVAAVKGRTITAPAYEGTVQVPYFGTFTIVLTPKP